MDMDSAMSKDTGKGMKSIEEADIAADNVADCAVDSHEPLKSNVRGRRRGRLTRRDASQANPFESMLSHGFNLIRQRGFSQVTVNDVLQASGVSRGTFYYHFSSMEHLLEILVQRDFQPLMMRLRELVANPEMSAVQKLNLFLGLAKNWETSSDDGIEMLLSLNVFPFNETYGRCVWNWLVNNTAPLLENILIFGVARNEFKLSITRNLGRAILILARDMTTDVVSVVVDEIIMGRDGVDTAFVRAGLYEKAISAFVGAEPGSVKIIYRNRLQKIVEYLSTQKGRAWLETMHRPHDVM